MKNHRMCLEKQFMLKGKSKRAIALRHIERNEVKSRCLFGDFGRFLHSLTLGGNDIFQTKNRNLKIELFMIFQKREVCHACSNILRVV